MVTDDGRVDSLAGAVQRPERLARVGFRVALAGSLVDLAALVVPEWRPAGFFPSMVQLLLQPATGQAGPTCVDSCGGHPLDGVIVLWGVYGGLLLLIAASQAFSREPHDTAASIGLLLGLGVLVPLAWGLISAIVAPSSTLGSQPAPVPDWSVLADSLGWFSLAGSLLVVIGNAVAVVGLLRRPRSVWVDWDALR